MAWKQNDREVTLISGILNYEKKRIRKKKKNRKEMNERKEKNVLNYPGT